MENYTPLTAFQKSFIILIDNGHGVDTLGKCSPDMSLREFQYVREIAIGVVSALKSLGWNAIRVVPENTDVPLTERVNRINKYWSQNKNTLAVSIHCNANSNGHWQAANYWTVWTSVGQTKGDVLATSLWTEANQLLKEHGIAAKGEYSDGDPDYEKNFTILKKTNCPCALTENLFQSTVPSYQY